MKFICGFFCTLFFLTLNLCPTSALAKPSPGVSGTLSIVPGLGQVSNGDTLEGLAWFTGTIALFVQKNADVQTVGLKMWMYNLYDAYRDAGGPETTQNNALQNYVAFLNPLNLIDPYSVGMVGYGAYQGFHYKGSQKAKIGPTSALSGAFYFGATGWGEEALFRGFLFPEFSYLTGSHVVGAVISSAAFAAAHLGNKQAFYHSASGLGQLFLWGLVWCAQASYQKYSLSDNIFSHAWFDFLTEYAGQPATGDVSPTFGIQAKIPFPY